MWFFKVRVFQLEKSTAGFPFSSEELQGGGRKGGADTQVHLKVNRFVNILFENDVKINPQQQPGASGLVLTDSNSN